MLLREKRVQIKASQRNGGKVYLSYKQLLLRLFGSFSCGCSHTWTAVDFGSGKEEK